MKIAWCVVAAAAALMVATPPRAQTWPVKTVRIVVFESFNWYGIFAPAGTPAAIVNRSSQEIASAIRLPDVREFMAKEGADPVGSTPQEFAAFFRSEVDRYAKVIRAANIRAE